MMHVLPSYVMVMFDQSIVVGKYPCVRLPALRIVGGPAFLPIMSMTYPVPTGVKNISMPMELSMEDMIAVSPLNDKYFIQKEIVQGVVGIILPAMPADCNCDPSKLNPC